MKNATLLYVKRIVALAAVASAAVPSLADTSFPTAGGDLASPGAWGGSIPADRALINLAGDYTVSDDVTLNGLTVDIGKDNDASFTVASGKTLTLGDTFNLIAPNGYNDLLLKGGTWNLSGKDFLPQNGYGSNNRHHYTLTLDGVNVTNVQNMTMGYYGASGYNAHILTNGASLKMSGSYQLAYQGKGNNLLHISGGSQMTVGGKFFFNRDVTASPSRVIVEGAGSKLTAGSDSKLNCADGCEFIIRDGASVDFGGGYWYWSSKNNTITVDGAEPLFGPLYLSGTNNVMYVRNGSSARFRSRVYANQSEISNADCGFDVEDSTLQFTTIYTSAASSTNFFLRVAGATAQISFQDENLYLYNARLIFSLPTVGYAADHVPVTATVQVGASNASFVLENLAEVQADIVAKGESSRTYRIMTATDLTNLDSARSAANATYAGNAVFTRNGTAIDVTVYGAPPTALTVVSPKGSPTPSVGTHDILYGAVVTARVEQTAYSGANSATRNRSTGFTGTGDAPTSGATNEVSFAQKQDSSVTWNWSAAEQKLYFGGTLKWTTAEVETYTGCTENWIPDGDFSQSAVWSDPDALAAAGCLRILAGGTYRIDRDVTIAGIDFSAKDEPVVFEAAGRTVTLTGSINPHTKSVVTLKGGTYDLNGNEFMPENSWANNNRRDMRIALDGAVVTNSSRFVFGYYSNAGNNVLCLTNGAVYHQTEASGHQNHFWVSYKGVGSNLIHVSSGSRLTSSAGLEFAHEGADNPSTVIVEGEGSSFKTGSASSLSGVRGNRLIVRNGAAFTFGGWWNMGTDTSVVISNTSVRANLSAPYFLGSNSTIRVCEASASLEMVYCKAGGSAARNNLIDVDNGDLFIEGTSVGSISEGDCASYRLSGTHPKIQHGATGGGMTSHFIPNARIIYNLPLAGYDTDESTGRPIVPFNLQNWGEFDETVSFEIENVDEIKADLAAKGRGSRRWKIFSWRNVTNLPKLIAASNAKYEGQGVSFAALSGQDVIQVTVRIPVGMILLVK